MALRARRKYVKRLKGKTEFKRKERERKRELVGVGEDETKKKKNPLGGSKKGKSQHFLLLNPCGMGSVGWE